MKSSLLALPLSLGLLVGCGAPPASPFDAGTNFHKGGGGGGAKTDGGSNPGTGTVTGDEAFPVKGAVYVLEERVDHDRHNVVLLSSAAQKNEVCAAVEAGSSLDVQGKVAIVSVLTPPGELALDTYVISFGSPTPDTASVGVADQNADGGTSFATATSGEVTLTAAVRGKSLGGDFNGVGLIDLGASAQRGDLSGSFSAVSCPAPPGPTTDGGTGDGGVEDPDPPDAGESGPNALTGSLAFTPAANGAMWFVQPGDADAGTPDIVRLYITASTQFETQFCSGATTYTPADFAQVVLVPAPGVVGSYSVTGGDALIVREQLTSTGDFSNVYSSSNGVVYVDSLDETTYVLSGSFLGGTLQNEGTGATGTLDGTFQARYACE